MITAYPVVFIGVLAQTLVMAEMASMYVYSSYHYPIRIAKITSLKDSALRWTIQLGRHSCTAQIRQFSVLHYWVALYNCLAGRVCSLRLPSFKSHLSYSLDGASGIRA
jgi:hypothetical protein